MRPQLMRSLLLLLPEQTREPSRRRAMGNTFHKSVKHLGAKKNLSHVLNVLHPGTKKEMLTPLLTFCFHAHRFCLRAYVVLRGAYAELTRSLRWLTRTTVLLTVGCLIVITPPIFFFKGGGQPSYNNFWESIAGIMICI